MHLRNSFESDCRLLAEGQDAKYWYQRPKCAS